MQLQEKKAAVEKMNDANSGHNRIQLDSDATRRGHGDTSPAMERTLRQAQDYLRRKVDKITTQMLRAISNDGEAGYHSEDIITGERFYLMVDEVKRELERRRGVATNFAMELFATYSAAAGNVNKNNEIIPPWDDLGDKVQGAWIATAECAIEKYRCLL